MIGKERHPLPPSGRHFPWWIFHCSDPSWEDSWGHNFQSLVFDFHRPQKLACVCWILFTCRIWHHRHPIFSSVGRWPGRFDHLSRQRWSENATLLTSSYCSDYIFHTWPLSLTKDNWLGSLRSASAMAESPEDRLSLSMIGCCTSYTQEASHLGEPDAVCDGPCPRVPIVLVLWVPPLGEQQHREAVLFAGEPETILACKRS